MLIVLLLPRVGGEGRIGTDEKVDAAVVVRDAGGGKLSRLIFAGCVESEAGVREIEGPRADAEPSFEGRA